MSGSVPTSKADGVPASSRGPGLNNSGWVVDAAIVSKYTVQPVVVTANNWTIACLGMRAPTHQPPLYPALNGGCRALPQNILPQWIEPKRRETGLLGVRISISFPPAPFQAFRGESDAIVLWRTMVDAVVSRPGWFGNVKCELR